MGAGGPRGKLDCRLPDGIRSLRHRRLGWSFGPSASFRTRSKPPAVACSKTEPAREEHLFSPRGTWRRPTLHRQRAEFHREVLANIIITSSPIGSNRSVEPRGGEGNPAPPMGAVDLLSMLNPAAKYGCGLVEGPTGSGTAESIPMKFPAVCPRRKRCLHQRITSRRRTALSARFGQGLGPRDDFRSSHHAHRIEEVRHRDTQRSRSGTPP